VKVEHFHPAYGGDRVQQPVSGRKGQRRYWRNDDAAAAVPVRRNAALTRDRSILYGGRHGHYLTPIWLNINQKCLYIYMRIEEYQLLYT